MIIGQLLFLFAWLMLTVAALIKVYQSRKFNTNQKVMLVILIVIAPLLGPAIAFAMSIDTSAPFWSNSATKDDAWIADSDTNNDSGGSVD
ncbi:MAG: hypothetical protein QGF15_00090 [Alteromonas macleodii]|jgi:formate-dependent nitrite reductase membrane component NrfD|nr:hypothetical protein [Alteromonas macleodii]